MLFVVARPNTGIGRLVPSSPSSASRTGFTALIAVAARLNKRCGNRGGYQQPSSVPTRRAMMKGHTMPEMTVTVVIPTIILCFTNTGTFATRSPPWNIALPIVGVVLICIGLALVSWTDWAFITFGKGTLAPWNPTQRLVVRGVYRHVRNPMISGVWCILLGEAVAFASLGLLVWFAIFCLANIIYIPLREEPELAKRFGDDYLLYKRNVPRWIPRLTPWEGLSENETGKQFRRGTGESQ
jgi:protein-S-isoprenylcysteine O-methyltransferase Ste14